MRMLLHPTHMEKEKEGKGKTKGMDGQKEGSGGPVGWWVWRGVVCGGLGSHGMVRSDMGWGGGVRCSVVWCGDE